MKVDSPKDRSSKRQKKITKFSTICCQHFAQDDFTVNSHKRRCLKKTAIPTVDFVVTRNDQPHHNHNSGLKTFENVEILEAEVDVVDESTVVEEEDPLNQNICSLCKAKSSKMSVVDDVCFGLIKKCLPLITIHDSLDNICFKCNGTLRSFSSFIDKVISTQCSAMTINLPEPTEESANFEFIRNIKTEPITNYECGEDRNQKLPFIQIVDFNDPSKFLPNVNQNQTTHPLTSSQNKCKILEIVDIKPFLYRNENQGLIQIPSEGFVEDDEIQIVPPNRQMKIELPDLNCVDELENIKKFPSAMNDHNYHRYNESDIKIEFDEDYQEHQTMDVLRICRLCKTNYDSVKKYLIHKLKQHPPNKSFRMRKVKIRSPDIRRLCRMAIEKRKIAKVVQNCLKTSEKSYPCGTCGKNFKGPKNLYQHRLSHTEVNKYSCKICHKTFKRAHGLRQHVKSIHENEKSHKCPVCDHRYLLKSDMTKCKHRSLRTSYRS